MPMKMPSKDALVFLLKAKLSAITDADWKKLHESFEQNRPDARIEFGLGLNTPDERVVYRLRLDILMTTELHDGK